MPKTRKLIPVVAIIIGLLLIISASGISCICKCSSWGPVTVTWDGSSPGTWTDNCEGFLPIPSISSGTDVLISSSLSCPPPPNCTPSYTWSVTKILGTPETPWNGAGLPASFSPAYPGCFTVVLNATCHNGISKVCSPCETTICICDIAGIACPGLCGCDITDMAVANDGNTIYVICSDNVYKSTDGGCNFGKCTLPSGFFAPPRAIAVSPDNPNAIAVCDNTIATGGFAAGTIYVSNNGCAGWAALPRVPGNAANTASVRDIAVGPTRPETLLNRDYAVAVADDVATLVDGGDILFIGYTAAWTSCAAGSAADNLTANQFDFTSVAFTPSFVGDRCLVAVGSDNATCGGYGGETVLFIIQTSDVAPVAIVLTPPGPVAINTVTALNGPADFDGAGVTAGCITASSIALPADFDPTSPPTGFRTFVGWTSVNGPAVAGGWDDVWRVDFMTVYKLQSGATSGIWSIDYYGDVMCVNSKLIAGEYATTNVWHTTNPCSASPTWGSATPPPVGVWLTVVAINPTNMNTCYAGTSGTGSCFSISIDNANTFHP